MKRYILIASPFAVVGLIVGVPWGLFAVIAGCLFALLTLFGLCIGELRNG